MDGRGMERRRRKGGGVRQRYSGPWLEPRGPWRHMYVTPLCEEGGVCLIDRGSPWGEELSWRDVDHLRGEGWPGGVGEEVRV